MATRLILPAAYSWQPQTVPRLARGALTENILDAVIPIGGTMVAINRSGQDVLTPTSGPLPAVTKYGKAMAYASSRYHSRNSAPEPLRTPQSSLKEVSMLVILKPTTASAATQSAFGYGSSGGTNPLFFVGNGLTAGRFGIRLRDTAGTNVDVQESATASLVNGETGLFIATRSESQNSIRLFANGRIVQDTTAGSAVGSVSFDRLTTGGLVRTSFGLQLVADISLAVAWSRALSLEEAVRLSANPWQIFDVPSKPIFINTAASGATYTVAAAQGSYTLTGQSAGLTRQAVLTAVQGSYTLTGQAAGLTRQAKMTADQGSYALTGQSAGLTRQAVLIAAQGAYALTGQDVTLTWSGAGAPTYTLTAVQGGYTLTGQAAGLTRQAKMTADQGSYSLTGQAALLTRQAKLTAAQGSYTLTGQTVTLTYTPVTGAYTLTAETGYYTLTGQNTALAYGSNSNLPTGSGKRKKLPYGWWETLEPAEIERAIERAEDAVEVAAEALTAPREERRAAAFELAAALAEIEINANLERIAALQAKQARAKVEAARREVQEQRRRFEALRLQIEADTRERKRIARLRDDEDALAVLLS